MICFEMPSTDPFLNQAFEEYIFTHITDDDVFLLWRNDPVVVFGCYQNPFAESNLTYAFLHGISALRRISGGGTVYHDRGNFNYAWMRRAVPGEGYDAFLAPMVEALRKLGIPAEQGRLCDIAIAGKKISGSAQKVSGGRVLHHGTLLYDADLTVLRAVFARNSGVYETKGIRSSPWPVANIRDSLGASAPETETFGQMLRTAFLPPDACMASLDAEALREVKDLADEKYRRWEWNFGRTPAYTFHNSFSLYGTACKITYYVDHGVVTEMFGEGLPFDPKLFLSERVDVKEWRSICIEQTGEDTLLPYLL